MAPRILRSFHHPAAYIALQYVVGGAKMREVALTELGLREGERVLDLGCGPAYYVGRLPPVDYVGFDTDADSIAWARRRFGDRGRFFCEELAERHLREIGRFDAVMMMGLLHHLDEPACDALLRLVGEALVPGGRAVSLDTVLYEGQSALSRALAKNDRGDFVRTPAGFERLARRSFGAVQGRVVGDCGLVVSAHYLMRLSDPRLVSTGEAG
jgi:SAM-dependent methyltransferase